MRLTIASLSVFQACALLMTATATAQHPDALSCAVWLSDPPENRRHPEEAAAITAVEETLARLVQPVTSLSQARRQLRDDPSSDCGRSDCAPEVARALDVEVIALVTVWPPPASGPHRGGPGTVSVSFIPAGGAPGIGDPPAQDTLTATAILATEMAHREFRTPRIATLEVETTPSGARLEIDGAHRGESPLRESLYPGTHEVRASLDGHGSVTESVELGPREERRLELTLEPIGAGPDDPPPVSPGRPSGGPDAAMLIVSAGFMAVGATGLGITIADLAIAAGEGHAITEEGFFALWLITGVVGLGVGIPLFAIGLDEGGAEVSAHLGPGSIQLSGAF